MAGRGWPSNRQAGTKAASRPREMRLGMVKLTRSVRPARITRVGKMVSRTAWRMIMVGSDSGAGSAAGSGLAMKEWLLGGGGLVTNRDCLGATEGASARRCDGVM